MITFDFKCGGGHRFEGWFASREEFERQLVARMIGCPLCDSKEVEKLPSKVSLHLSRNTEGQGAPEGETETPRAFYAELARFVSENFQDVGEKFASEAIKMKKGEADQRAIRGTTTQADEEALADEGVEFLKIALPKYDA